MESMVNETNKNLKFNYSLIRLDSQVPKKAKEIES